MSQPPPSPINPDLRPRSHRSWTVQDYQQRLAQGDRVALARAITLAESNRSADRKLAHQLLEAILPDPNAPTTLRLGITGVPGVGKSTFIERFGLALIEAGHRVAVLAIDPSSRISHGSILGDKTRMAQLSTHERAFVRPTAAGTTLGGVGGATREAVLLCEAAGFDVVIVETVGVGQSETAVFDVVDCFLLLLLPGAGDELQGIKRGIVEMADIVAVNKADGTQQIAAQQARRDYARALHLFPPKPSGWPVEVLTCSAHTGAGIDKIVATVEKCRLFLLQNGYLLQHRQAQQRQWLHGLLGQALLRRFYEHSAVAKALPQAEAAVAQGQELAPLAAERLLKLFLPVAD